MHAESLGQIALRDVARDAEPDEQGAEADEIVELVEVAGSKSLVRLDLLFELTAKRLHRIDDAIDLAG